MSLRQLQHIAVHRMGKIVHVRVGSVSKRGAIKKLSLIGRLVGFFQGNLLLSLDVVDTTTGLTAWNQVVHVPSSELIGIRLWNGHHGDFQDFQVLSS